MHINILTDEGSTNIENKKQNKFQDSIDYLNQKIYTLVDHIKKTNPEKPKNPTSEKNHLSNPLKFQTGQYLRKLKTTCA